MGDIEGGAAYEDQVKAQLAAAKAKIQAGALAVIFQDSDWGGASTALGKGNWNLEQMGIPNDSLSSAVVAPGYQLILYRDRDWKGDTYAIKGDAGELPGNWNDQASSLTVIEDQSGFPDDRRGNQDRNQGQPQGGAGNVGVLPPDMFGRAVKVRPGVVAVGNVASWKAKGYFAGTDSIYDPFPTYEENGRIWWYPVRVENEWNPAGNGYDEIVKGGIRVKVTYRAQWKPPAGHTPNPNGPVHGGPLPEGRRLTDDQLAAMKYPPAPAYVAGTVVNQADIARWKELHPGGAPVPKPGDPVVPPPPPADGSGGLSPEAIEWYTYGYNRGAGFSVLSYQPATALQLQWFTEGYNDAVNGRARRYGVGPMAPGAIGLGPQLNIYFELVATLFGLKVPYDVAFSEMSGIVGQVVRYGVKWKLTDDDRRGWGLAGPWGAVADLAREEYGDDPGAYGAPVFVGAKTVDGARLVEPSELRMRFGARWYTKIRPQMVTPRGRRGYVVPPPAPARRY